MALLKRMLSFLSWVKSSITHKQIIKGPTNLRNSSLECRYSGVAPEPALLVLLTTMGTCRSGEQDTRVVSCAWWVRKSAHDVATRSTSLPEGTTQQGCKSCNAVSLIMQKCRRSDEVSTETGFLFSVNTYIHLKNPNMALNYGVCDLTAFQGDLKFYIFWFCLWKEQLQLTNPNSICSFAGTLMDSLNNFLKCILV